MVDSNLDPVIFSSCMFLENETSDIQFKFVVKQVRWDVDILRQITSLLYSPSVHLYPSLDINIEAVIREMEISHIP